MSACSTRAYLGALRYYGNSTTAPYSDLYAATSDDIRRSLGYHFAIGYPF